MVFDKSPDGAIAVTATSQALTHLERGSLNTSTASMLCDFANNIKKIEVLNKNSNALVGILFHTAFSSIWLLLLANSQRSFSFGASARLNKLNDQPINNLPYDETDCGPGVSNAH
jgi:hypothetical protein